MSFILLTMFWIILASNMRLSLLLWTKSLSCLNSIVKNNPFLKPCQLQSIFHSILSTSTKDWLFLDLYDAKCRIKTQKNRSKFSRKWKFPKLHSKTSKNMLKHLTGSLNTLRKPLKTRVSCSEDQFMQDKYSQIINALIFTCIKNSLNFTNSIMRDAFTPFIQR